MPFVLIPSFQLDNQAPHAGQRQWKPKFFHNYPGPDSDGAELVVDVAMRTSAAPIYFPTYQSYIDGGVVANDPSMAALAHRNCRAGDERQEVQPPRWLPRQARPAVMRASTQVHGWPQTA